MSEKLLLLVDGSSYLYRAYHAMPDLRAEGFPTGAIHGVVAMLGRLRQQYDAAHAACVFDAKGPTFRDEWYPAYKAHRSPMPDDLARQIEPIHEAVRLLGWPVLEVPGVEADDTIGTLCRAAVDDGFRVVVSTGDKDLAQLVNARVTLINTMSNETLDVAGVEAKFGVAPERVVDYLTLLGDAVDNVPGVDKVGPKTAAKWLAEHGSLDGVVAAAAGFKGQAGDNLRAALDWLPQGRRLVTVRTDCELADQVDGWPSLQALALRPADRDGLLAFYRRYGFRTWRQELEAAVEAERRVAAPPRRRRETALGATASLPGMDGAVEGAVEDETPGTTGGSTDGGTQRRSGGSAGGEERAAGAANAGGTAADPAARPAGAPAATAAAPAAGPPSNPLTSDGQPLAHDYETVVDRARLAQWIERLKAAPLAAVDTETDSLDAVRARIVGISFAVEPGRAAYVPLAHDYPGVPDQLPADEVLAALRPWLEDAAHAKVGQNVKYDLQVLAGAGVQGRGFVHDTMLQSYVLEAHRGHGLEALADRHLERRGLSYEDVCGKGAAQIPFAQVELGRAALYSGEDSEMTLDVHRVLWPRLAADERLRWVYEHLEMPVVGVLQRIERHGVLIDAVQLARQSGQLAERMVALEHEAHELAGQPFNMGSPKQIGEILFGKLGLPVKRRTAAGAPSTDEAVLAELAADYPLPARILEHRGLAKLKGTYTDKLPLMVNPDTGRVHTTYAQAVAVTGRLSSNDPNLQNIPIRTAEGRRVREAFVAPPGHALMSADYSQIELRIMAHLSDDSALLSAFERGLDVHRATAAEMFSVAVDGVSAEQRRYAKTINFGLMYGMGTYGLAANLGIEQKTARDFIERYFARFAGVKRFMDDTRAQAKSQGFVETVFGRRLWLPEINSGNGPRRAAAERQAINAPMQGTAADLIKLAMVAVQQALDDGGRATRMVLQVHDELVLEVPEAELAWAREALPRLMAGVAQLKVPLLAEVGVGPNWEQAH